MFDVIGIKRTDKITKLRSNRLQGLEGKHILQISKMASAFSLYC